MALFKDTPQHRRKNMSSIRSKGNATTEKKLRAIMAAAGIRGWRMHPCSLAGNPDFYFPKHNLVIFVDGCFWHYCSRCGHVPRTNKNYWQKKLANNKRRDLSNSKRLRSLGLTVLRIKECELKKSPWQQLRRVLRYLAF